MRWKYKYILARIGARKGVIAWGVFLRLTIVSLSSDKPESSVSGGGGFNGTGLLCRNTQVQLFKNFVRQLLIEEEEKLLALF